MGSNRSLSARLFEKPWLRYAMAVLVVLLAALVCSALSPVTGDRAPYVILLAAIAFCAWYCGPGASVVAIALVVLGFLFGFVPTLHKFTVPSLGESVAILAFVISSLLIVLMGVWRRRENVALLREQGELESRVQERTADLDVVNRNLRELSARLMQLQDDERRRIARELHDSVGQMLAALSMNLFAVRGDVEQLAKTLAALTDSETLVRDMSAEVRTISHLLHPPLLDEAGLSSALRWYVEGFAQRSRIKVELDLPEEFGRLSSEMETAIFRVIQECLTNIHRHSGSEVARIRLRRREHEVIVVIEDKGRGIPADKLQEMAKSGRLGVGIRGMRERLRQLNGTLLIESNSAGTTITVHLPLVENQTRETDPAIDRPSPAAA